MSDQEQTTASRSNQSRRLPADLLIANKRRMLDLVSEHCRTLINRCVTVGLAAGVSLIDSGIQEVGRIPAGWQALRMKNVARISPGRFDLANDSSCDQQFYLTPDSIEPLAGKVVNPPFAGDVGVRQVVGVARKGEVLFSRVHPALARAWVADADCVHNGGIFTLQPANGVDAHWLSWAVRSDMFHGQLSPLVHAKPGVAAVTADDFYAAYVVLPPPEMQVELAAKLAERVQAHSEILALTKKSISLLEERQSMLDSVEQEDSGPSMS